MGTDNAKRRGTGAGAENEDPKAVFDDAKAAASWPLDRSTLKKVYLSRNVRVGLIIADLLYLLYFRNTTSSPLEISKRLLNAPKRINSHEKFHLAELITSLV